MNLASGGTGRLPEDSNEIATEDLRGLIAAETALQHLVG